MDLIRLTQYILPQPSFILKRSHTYHVPTAMTTKPSMRTLTIMNSGLMATKVGEYSETVDIRGFPIDGRDTEKFFILQNQINYCLNDAEHLNSTLRGFMVNLCKNDAERKTTIRKDFMGLRDLFSQYVRSFKPLKHIEFCDSPSKLSAITSLFFDYITDRNIYTHGNLVFYYKTDKLLLEYVKKDEVAYCEVTEEKLNSFNSTYYNLLNFINLVRHLTTDENNTEETKNLIAFCLNKDQELISK